MSIDGISYRNPGLSGTREEWEAYLAWLKKLPTTERQQIEVERAEYSIAWATAWEAGDKTKARAIQAARMALLNDRIQKIRESYQKSSNT
jgi:hypothetical protein